jgi:hypothetical protein
MHRGKYRKVLESPREAREDQRNPMNHLKLFNSPKILWQETGDCGIPEQAIAGHVDNGETICLGQAGHSIVLNPESALSLVRMLRELRRDAYAQRAAKNAITLTRVDKVKL